MVTSVKMRDEYAAMLPHIKAVRTAVRGQYAVKDQNYLYLPHPSEVDQTSDSAVARYRTYLAGAEFDEFPAQTLAATAGKMKVGSAYIELPGDIEYLEQDADGDGQSIKQMMERSVSEALQIKWQALVVEYQGLSGLDLSQLSKAETDALSPRATIKAYNRETVIDWEFERKNGVMQLVYIVFRELANEFSPTTRVRKEVESDLVLALDENGDYYQQKIVDGAQGERDYVAVNGKRLKWLPVLFVSDQELTPGRLPEPLGYLGAICDLAYARYRVSADYKEAMRALPPTTYTKGWKSGDIDTFTEANNGRTAIETGAGAVNNLPGEVTVSIEGADTELGGYERYMDANERKVRALGGVFKADEGSDRTAMEASIEAGERVAKLETLADSVENGYKKACLYCGMFEGLFRVENLEANMDQIIIDLPRDFAKPVLSPEQVDRVINLVLSGLMSVDQAVRKLVEGGWHMDDAEQVLAELQSSGPPPAPPRQTGASDEPQAVPANN